MTEITDSKILEITEMAFNTFKSIKKQEELDPDKLTQFKQGYIKLLYPRKQGQDSKMRKYFCCQICCQESSGNFICSHNSPHTSFIKNGLGICLYFNYLKHSSFFYFILSLFALLSCTVCVAVAIQNGFTPTSSYNIFLFSTSYGSYSSQNNKCQYSKIDSLGNASFALSCPYGTLRKFGSIFTNQSLNTLHNCRNERKNQQQGQHSTSKYTLLQTSSCNSQGNSCTINVQLNGLQTDKLISYTYECINNVYQIGSLKAKGSYFIYFTVAIDLFFCLCYFFFLLTQNISQKRQQNFFKSNQLTLNDFSIEVEGLNRKQAEKQLLELTKYINQRLGEPMQDHLFAFTLPECQEMISNHYNQKQAYLNVYFLMNKYYFTSQKAVENFKECHQNMIIQIGEQQYQEFKRQLKDSIKNFSSLNRKKIYKQSDEQLPLFLVFKNINSKVKFMELQQKRCCEDRLIIQNKEYKFKEPSLPDMIQWQNRTRWTKLRVIVSWLMTLILCLCSYMLFGFIQYKQSQIFSTYNYGIDCNVLFTPQQLSTFTKTLSNDFNYQTCICKNQGLLSSGSQNSSYCTTWQKQYVFYLAVPLIISFGIVVYNVFISYVFKLLTKFEKQKFVVHQQISYTFKRAFLLILNMGVIMTILNVNFSTESINSAQDVSFLFAGQYDDFTSDWYYTIGSIIILTMIFNIAFPIIELLLTSTIKGLRKLWDTRCCRVPTSCKTKKQYLSLYSDDQFPIGQRYAYLISTLFVSLGFCGVIPILIPVAAISFTLLYFADKILLFKIYQVPINYTKALHSVLRKIIVLALLAHFGFTAYLLAQPSMIADEEVALQSIYSTGNARLNSMFTIKYIIPYSIAFLLLATIILLKSFVFSLFSKCYQLIKDKFIQPNERFKSIEFAKLLNKRQIKTLLKIYQLNLDTIQLKRQESALRVTQTVSEKDLATQLEVQERLINKTVEILTVANNQDNSSENNIHLIGLPSYQYLIKSEQFKIYNEMIEFQKKLKGHPSKADPYQTGFTYKNSGDQSSQNFHKVVMGYDD